MAQRDGVHNRECAARIRVRALVQAGEPADPPVALLHRIAREIGDCCGLGPLKAHRLAWGWTVERAVDEFHLMCERADLGSHGLTARSWLGWEAGGRPSDRYRDLLCRLFETSGVTLGFASDYTPHATPITSTDVPAGPVRAAAPAGEPAAPVEVRDGDATRVPTVARQPLRSVIPEAAGVSTELPRTSGFVGRRRELSAIGEAMLRFPAVAVVGRRGVGTSTCAVQAANQSTVDLSGGRFYLDLRPGGRPLAARQVLSALTTWAGVAPPPPSASPGELTAAANRLRDRLTSARGGGGPHGQRLLVLDNVDEPSQIDAVLPLPETCRVLISGGPGLEDLPSLTGVTVCPLEEPGPDDALELCVSAASTVANPAVRPQELRAAPAIRELVELCGRQPLLLRALGRETARLGWDLDEVAAEFRQAVSTPPHETMSRSDALAVLAGKDVVYAALSEPARRLLRLLSLSPECFGRGAIAALLGPTVRRPLRSAPRSPREVRRRAADAVFGPPTEWIDQLLGELSGGRFVDGSGGRYQVRELLAPQVRLHLLSDEPVRRRIGAQGRVMRHLARQAARHAARLHAPSTGGSGGDPMAWFALQHALLHSLVVGEPGGPRATREPLPRRVRRWRFHLAEALCAWYAAAWRLDEWADVCEAILTTPGSAEHPRSASWAHNQLGVVHRRRSELSDAKRELVLARSLRRGSRRGTAQVLTNEGMVLLADDEVEPALQRLRLARDHRPAANRPGRALTDMGLGVAQLAAGEVDDARRTFASAANMFGELEDPRGQGAALTNLGLAQWRRGERYDAYQTWELALEAYAEVDDTAGRAAALLNLGASHLLIEPHDADAALARLSESERLWAGLGASTTGLGRTLVYKGDALALLGCEDEARNAWKQAREICQEVGDKGGQDVAGERLQSLTPGA